VKIKEGSNAVGVSGKEYGLMIQSVIENAGSIQPEVEQIRANVLVWIEKRGTECAKLDLIVIADVGIHDEITKQVLQKFNSDDRLSPAVSKLSRARLMLWNREQTKYQSLLLKAASDSSRTSVR
jgi:hypothetical protein